MNEKADLLKVYPPIASRRVFWRRLSILYNGDQSTPQAPVPTPTIRRIK